MKNISLYIDLVFCLIVLPVMVTMFPVERWFHHFPSYVTAVGVWLYVVYFVNRAFTVPSLFSGRRHRVVGIVVIILSLAMTYALTRVNLYTPRPNVFDEGVVKIFPLVLPYQQAVWSLYMIVMAFSFAVGLLTQVNEQKSRRRAVEADRARTEIELYKAQIKPHFMFNTLNSLYGLFLTNNDKALESLEKFVSMMRYIHTSSKCDLVQLDDEIDYIRRYVSLQSLRLNGVTTVELDIDIRDKGLQVPPMLMVTFVENCFKHGVSPVEECRIGITITEHDGKLLFRTRNRIFPVERIGEHMGIDNCRKRLELLYPSRHSLKVGDDGRYFEVELLIDLTV